MKVQLNLEIELPDSVDLQKLYLVDEPKLRLKDNYIGEQEVKYKILNSVLNDNKQITQTQEKKTVDSVDYDDDDGTLRVNGYSGVEVRGLGEYAGIAFYLNEAFDWEIKKDSLNDLVLVPYFKN